MPHFRIEDYRFEQLRLKPESMRCILGLGNAKNGINSNATARDLQEAST